MATLVPRDVYCPIEHLYQDRSLAEDACSNTFTNAGATVTIAGVPNWLDTGVHPDLEWWIEWSKFYVGLDLAFAHETTHERRFADAWVRLVSSWIDQVPASFGPTDAAARRIQNWVYAWRRFASSTWFDGFDPAFADGLTRSIDEQARHIQSNLTPERNHRTLELYALLVVGLALPELDATRAQRAWAALHDNLLTDIRPDGVQREHSTHYHMVALRSFVAARENARRAGLAVQPSYDDRLAAACEFAMHCIRPDGSIPQLSDSDAADHRDTLLLAARLLDRPDFLYAATAGRSGNEPRRTVADFPAAGYFIQRRGWTMDAPGGSQHLIFDCGAPGDGGHGHYDALSVDVWAGRPLLVDPGRFTYAEGQPDWRQWFKGTAAHNTVTVDARDQTPYRAGKPRGACAEATVLRVSHAPAFDVVGGEVVSPCYDAVHRRHVFFVGQEYWIVLDQLYAPTPHDYALRWHLAAEALGRIRLQSGRITAPGMSLLVKGSDDVSIERGWVSPSYGIKHAAPVVVARSCGCNAAFVTVIVPESRAADRRAPVVRVDRGDALQIEVGHAGAYGTVDLIAFDPAGCVTLDGASRCCGDVAWVRRDGRGAVRSFVVCGAAANGSCAASDRAWVAWRRGEPVQTNPGWRQ